eukprot:jgi/Botrbrau1/19954/Bobra.0059s0070.1
MDNLIHYSGINKVYILTNGDLLAPRARRRDLSNTSNFQGADGFLKVVPIGPNMEYTRIGKCLEKLLDQDITKHSVQDIVFLPAQHESLLNELSLRQKAAPNRSRLSSFRQLMVDKGLCRAPSVYSEDDPKAMQVDTTRFGLDEHQAAECPYIASGGIYAFKRDFLLQLAKRSSLLIEYKVLRSAVSDPSVHVQAYLLTNLFTGQKAARWRLLSAMDKQAWWLGMMAFVLNADGSSGLCPQPSPESKIIPEYL